MIQNKLIRAKNGNENTSNFTTYLNPPIVLSENSSIGLQTFNMELTPNVIDITSETQKISYATVKPSAGSYDQLILEHTFIIPLSAYSQTDLAYIMTQEANKQLYYETTNDHSKEQGSEILFFYDKTTEQISFNYAARLSNQFCGTPVDKVKQTDLTGNSYSYALDASGAGEVTRLTDDETTFDFYHYSTIPFCRGSGEIIIDVTQSVNNYVIGLINPIHLLSNPDSNTILQKIKYGIMLLDNTSTYDINDYPQDEILLKNGEDSDWEAQSDTTTDEIKFILGKQTTYQADGYKLFIERDSYIDKFEYEYGNYVLICATYTKDNVLTYNICESKLASTTTTEKGYYTEINPHYLNLSSNHFVSLENNKYNDDGLGFLPNQAGSYITLNLFNDETMQLFGFNKKEIESNDIYAAQDQTINIIPLFKINSRYQFPNNLKLIVDLPLDSYDSGKSENILSFIPNNVNSDGFITYQPSPPLFITLKNNRSLYLDHITFKLYDDKDVLLPPQIASSAVVIIQSIK
jgi:hypothetical protein